MDRYVYCAGDLVVPWGTLPGSRVPLRRGDVWFADDPFVLDRPDLFSATPLEVYSTVGREGPGPTAVEAGRTVAAYAEAFTEPATGRGRGRRG